MIAAYLLRMLCLCLAAFFVIHTAVGLTVALVTPAAVRAAERMRPRHAAHFLLVLRLLPATLGLLLVVGFCAPSYLLLEPMTNAEEVGIFCLAAAMLTVYLWFGSVGHSLFVAARSWRHSRDWERTGTHAGLPGARQVALVVDIPAPLLALSGVFRTRLVISRLVVASLSAEQLRAALCHEEAHRDAHDNLKRLLMLLTPGVLPGWNGLHALERGWSRFTEWAADDDAVAGSPRLSLALAAALVRIARLGGTPTALPLTASFLADESDLSARVDRLLRPSQAAMPEMPRAPAIVVMVTLAALVVAVSFNAGALESAHQLLEHLIN